MTHAPSPKNLAAALTFHASFDNGPDANYARGDSRMYTATILDGQTVASLIPGLGDPALDLVAGAGKYGAALAFTQANSHVVVYRAEQNVAYSPRAFRGTASFWLRLDPAEIPGRYSDPFQMTDKNFSDDCLWVDFTKNDLPSDFRLGVFGNRGAWDVTNRREQSEEFFFRLAKVAEPPFARDRWTHVAITWDGINLAQPGRARLYFDTVYQGSTGAIREPFTWDVANAAIRLGMGHFVGLFDDIALFDRPLTPEEIRLLNGLDRGVAELHG